MLCQHCGKVFSTSGNLFRHIRLHCDYNDESQPIKKIKVELEKSAVDEERNGVSSNQKLSIDNLPGCSNEKLSKLNPHVLENLKNGVEKLHCAFKNRIASIRFNNILNKTDPLLFFHDVKQQVLDIIEQYLKMHNSLKINLELFGIYVIPEKEQQDIKSFNTKNKVFTRSSNLTQIYEEFQDEILSKASDFQERDSNWTLEKILFLDVNINRYNPISATSYIRLPKFIQNKKAVLNIRNDDNACFAWCITAALHPVNQYPHLTSSYSHYSTFLNFDNIEFPVKLKDIKKFEELNEISVNVFGIDSSFKDGKCELEIVGPLYFTSNRRERHVNLLLVSDDNGNHHYCLIKNLSKLVSSQISKSKHGMYICDGCLQNFQKQDQLLKHQKKDCNHLYTITPSNDLIINKFGEFVPENQLKFINFEKQLPVPFVIYADFESLLKPIQHNEPCNSESFTVKTFEHEPYSFGIYVKCNFDNSFSNYYSYRGYNAAEKFTEKLDGIVLDIYNNHLKQPKKMMTLTFEEQEEFNKSRLCHICDKPFSPDDEKVRDHCHLTGKYRSAAHSICNLNYKIPKFIPVVLHNLTNYDSHLFIKKLAMKGETVNVIAQNKEKYITFSKHILVEKFADPKIPNKYLKLRFIDSFRFLSRSLDKLSANLESHQCIEIRKYFRDEIEFNLIRRKGVFPYNYVDCFNKLLETKLPSKQDFFNKLSGESITNEDYDRAKEIWKIFKCSSLGEYSDIYLKSDVLLLADVFENFRSVCMNKYKLDPAHYLTAPSLSWDAMLKYTNVELELLTDIDMIHFLRKGIRGGVSQCSKRKAIANNKFLSNYDPSKRSSYIMYLDATNLYGFAMQQHLPKGDFRWLEKEEIDTFDCSLIENESSKGYILEVDLQYPPQLHEAHNDFPFCPEQIIPSGSKYPKLIPNLKDKHNYIIHYRNLKQCLKYGLKLKKVHRILEFTQSPWLKPYIDLNTSLRNIAKNEFERDLFKLIINSIFGKTMENVDKRSDIKLCTHWENRKGVRGARGLIAKPNFKSSSVFTDSFVAIQMEKLKICYDKPLYVGFSILDISKTVIYEFFYGYLKQKYGENVILCYTDTDSLILEIFTENVYDDIKKDIDLFDTSNFAEDNIHKIPKTLSVVGKMKDEFAGMPVECFYGTGAKAYCIKGDEIWKKAKGISKHVIKNQLHLSDYIQTVENGEFVFRKMYIFKSNLHTIYTELKNKVALSSNDDKRFIIPGDVRTLAWGHFGITPITHFEDDDLEVFLKLCEEETFNEDPMTDIEKLNEDPMSQEELESLINFDLDLL